jgi:hypothetical protein
VLVVAITLAIMAVQAVVVVLLPVLLKVSAWVIAVAQPAQDKVLMVGQVIHLEHQAQLLKVVAVVVKVQ